MTDQPATPQTAGRSPALKLLAIGALTLLAIVPLFLIGMVTEERAGRAEEAKFDVAQGWGGPQRIAGPFLAVPYIALVKSTNAARPDTFEEVRQVAVFLPRTLAIAADAQSEVRSRGIFDVTVFRSALSMKGMFEAPRFDGLGVTPARVLWAEAYVFLQVSDVRGIASNVALGWDGKAEAAQFEPGVGADLAANPGVHARIALDENADGHEFALELKINGTGELAVAPVGDDTALSLKSNWPHPSFQGAFLPDSKTISAAGFEATWSVPYLRRSLPNASLDPYQLLEAVGPTHFGVSFYTPVDFYRLVDRALKYAVLFVGLSFLVFFLVEILSGGRVHAVQYILAGAAQVVFYLLLLSLAEHIGFDFAYIAAAAATVALTFAYALAVLKSRKRALIVLAAASVLYTLLYLLLGEEDYALLIGSGALFLVLALTMFATRKIDWYQLRFELPKGDGLAAAGR